MITAVDTNVLLDVLVPGAPHRDASRQAITEALRLGATVISEAVYSELAARFSVREDLDQFLVDTGIRRQPSYPQALYQAGREWRAYLDRRPRSLACPSCGNAQDVRCSVCGVLLATRQHVIADFMIGAHAVVHADRFLTRDRGYYRTYFPALQLA